LNGAKGQVQPGIPSPETMVIMSIPFQKGEMALICRGPFAGKRGTITRIDAGSVTVMCDVFDRDTAVEVALSDVGPPPAP